MPDQEFRRWANIILVAGFVLAIAVDHGAAFLSILLITIAFTLLLRTFSAFQLGEFSKKLQNFIWLVGVGMFFLPRGGGLHWLLIAFVVSIIAKAFMASFARDARCTVVPNRQQAPLVAQQAYRFYEPGYQPIMPMQQSYPVVEQPAALQAYEQPQAYYPQEMPPL